MEKRHAKVDVCGEVIQKGGRYQSSASAQGRVSSAASGQHRISSSSFRSLKSGQFREVELKASVEEQPSMKGKVVPDDTYKVLDKVEDSELAAAYDNKGLELEEGVNHVVSSKLSVSSASSYGLVMEGSRSQRAANGASVEADSSVTGVSVEGKKYALTDYETTSIKVKEAAAKTLTDNIIESAVEPKKSVSGDKVLVDSTEMKEMQPAQTAEEVDSSKNLETAPEEEVTLKRSSTVETNSSLPSTSYTFESSQRPSTSFFDSQRDETLLIGDQTNIGSSTISQTATSILGQPPKRFEVPPGMSPTSYRTYRMIQKEGFKPGRCMLIIVVIVTFCVTMVLAVLILIAPQSNREKTGGSESSLLESTTPSPGPWSMKSGSLMKGVVTLQRIDDAIHRLLTANVSLDDLDTNS